MMWSRKPRAKKQCDISKLIHRTDLARALCQTLRVTLDGKQERALRAVLDEAVARKNLMPIRQGSAQFAREALLSFACGQTWKRTLEELNAACGRYVGPHGAKVMLRKGGAARPDTRMRKTERKTPRRDRLHVPAMVAAVGEVAVQVEGPQRSTVAATAPKPAKASWFDVLLSRK